MPKPRLLDLFCGAGGMTKGYQRAGFHVVGVDFSSQPRYCGDEFVQADALTFPLKGFDAIAASPPCQRYSALRTTSASRGAAHPDLVGPVRDRIQAAGLPYVIENVVGAPLQDPVLLCGSMFGLGVAGRQLRRHRLFEASFPILTPRCRHEGMAVGVYGGGPTGVNGPNRRGAWQGTAEESRQAMGIGWMTKAELNNAIPPAYGEFVGEQLMRHLGWSSDTPS